jgi:ribosomal protein S12 methylthiotransferase
MPKVGLVSLGCPKNTVDSEIMLGMLTARGCELTPKPKEADVIVVNTCSFIGPAKQESIDTILEMAEYKKAGSAKRLVVAGCLVERYRQQILAEMPEVDYVLGTNELERVAEACDLSTSARESGRSASPYLYNQFTPRILSTSAHTAYIKIAEGCDHTCSFCVIPQMRGSFRSRRFESVVAEAEALARRGVRELVLVGQDNTSYGEDLGLHDGLATLLRELAAIPGLVWLRFLYCYPNRVTDALIEAVAGSPKIAKYFDIPFQHASGPVLKAMRRGSNAAQFLKLIEKIRTAIPGATLRSSLIVGFPGETEDDFNRLAEFVAAAEFDHLGVFRYSNEETSASYALSGQVSASTSYNRQRKILAQQRKISRAKLRRLVGQRLPVVVDGPSPDTPLLFTGRLESQAPQVDGEVFVNDFHGAAPEPGEYRWATITGASDYDLIARLEPELFAEPLPLDQMQLLPSEVAVGGVKAHRRTAVEAAQGLVQIQPTAQLAKPYALPHL